MPMVTEYKPAKNEEINYENIAGWLLGAGSVAVFLWGGGSINNWHQNIEGQKKAQLEKPQIQQEMKSGKYQSKDDALVEYNKLKTELAELYVKKEKSYQANSPDFKDLQEKYKSIEKKMNEITFSE